MPNVEPAHRPAALLRQPVGAGPPRGRAPFELARPPIGAVEGSRRPKPHIAAPGLRAGRSPVIRGDSAQSQPPPWAANEIKRKALGMALRQPRLLAAACGLPRSASQARSTPLTGVAGASRAPLRPVRSAMHRVRPSAHEHRVRRSITGRLAQPPSSDRSQSSLCGVGNRADAEVPLFGLRRRRRGIL